MPTSKVQWIGFLWWGGSVKIRPEKPVSGEGCSGLWVAVQPRGWVCVDEEQATQNPKDPALLSIYPFRPRVESAWPHRYAAVHAETRRYDAVPEADVQKTWEVGYERHMELVLAARKNGPSAELPGGLRWLDPSLTGKAPPALLALPKGLSEGNTHIAARSAMTYSGEADFGQRAFLLTGDLSWVPKDRVEPLEPSEFHGVELGDKLHLPLAFFKRESTPLYRRTESGDFEKVEKTYPRLSHVQLKEPAIKVGHTRYYALEAQESLEGSSSPEAQVLYVSDREAVIPVPKDKTPWGATVGAEDTSGTAREGRGTWLEASILGGWMVAFEGTRPVYATMISAGRGGTPQAGKDPLATASTPTGRFPIGGKFRTATMMSSSTPIVHADVPWTQNFSGPWAIHSAYWHDDFGKLKSAGCVNVSPLDGKWLFEFTEPEVPEGWHGVRYVSRYGGGSTLFILHE